MNHVVCKASAHQQLWSCWYHWCRLHRGFIFDSSELMNALRRLELYQGGSSFTTQTFFTLETHRGRRYLSLLEDDIAIQADIFPVTGRPENMAYFLCMVLCSFPAWKPGKQQGDLALLCSCTKSPLSCHFVLLPDLWSLLSWALKDQRAVSGFVC